MDNAEIGKVEFRIRQLQRELNTHILSYAQGEPLITDAQYDRDMLELKALEAKLPQFIIAASPTQRVGAPVSSDRPLIKHARPMLSLENIYTEEDADKRFSGKPVERFSVEPKFDGVSLKLIYIDGTLVEAALRGDGFQGENVTANAQTIRNLPLRISQQGLLEVRGEVVMKKSVFKKLNAELAAQGEKLMSNPRNSAAGAMRQLDPAKCAEKQVSFFAYDAIGAEEPTQLEKLFFLDTLGFEVYPPEMESIRASQLGIVYRLFQELREKLDFEIDGVVIKYDDPAMRAELGETNLAPRWAAAWKFPPAEVTTKVTGLRLQVGRTGQVTPVADVEPVEIGGVVVSKATLHNKGYMERLGGISAGATVTLQRAGDVIPQITRALRVPLEMSWEFPDYCPSCNSLLISAGAKHFCANPECKGQIAALLQHSTKVLGIDGIGPETAEMLVQTYGVRSLQDFYELNGKTLIVDSGGVEYAAKARLGLQLPEHVSLAKFIECLGIEGMGEVKSAKLAEAAKTLEGLHAMTPQDFAFLGALKESVHAHFSHPLTWAGIMAIARKLNVQPHPEPTVGPLTGLTIVVTGTLKEYTRDSIKEAIVNAGGKIGSSVSKKTNYLIVGDDAGSKHADALKHKVLCLTEQQFVQLLSS